MTTTILKGKNMVLLLIALLGVVLSAYIIFRALTPILPVTHEGHYPYKAAMTTLFWVGEAADEENDYISNTPSYWDEEWQEHFGGVDNPESRCGYLPCNFNPHENPFYVALPYAEYDEDGNSKESAKNIPWYAESLETGESLLKNRWVEVVYQGTTCFGQLEDVGPNGEDDFAYVFGSSTVPTNTFGEKAGLDISPALRTCLHMTDNATTTWRFMDAKDVPEGPWKTIITTSGINWTQ